VLRGGMLSSSFWTTENAQGMATAVSHAWHDCKPLITLQEPRDDMTEERRRELIELGFPDDGYDYLKHLRAPGRGGRANLEGPGPAADSFAGERFRAFVLHGGQVLVSRCFGISNKCVLVPLEHARSSRHPSAKHRNFAVLCRSFGVCAVDDAELGAGG